MDSEKQSLLDEGKGLIEDLLLKSQRASGPVVGRRARPGAKPVHVGIAKRGKPNKQKAKAKAAKQARKKNRRR